jgi:antirestriction protein
MGGYRMIVKMKDVIETHEAYKSKLDALHTVRTMMASSNAFNDEYRGKLTDAIKYLESEIETTHKKMKDIEDLDFQ